MANAKIGGTWRTVKLPYARVSGAWKPCKQMYAKVGGVWKIVFDLTEPDPFDGSGSLSGALTPGYVPWETVSGTWTKSGGNVSAGDASDRVAAVETGLENIEVEIDRTTAATGGDGVAFWIQDQSNWWGVRAYTEEYFVPFSFNTYYPFNVYQGTMSRSTSTVPGTNNPGNVLTPSSNTPGNIATPGNAVPGTCTNTTGCTGVGCCAGTQIAGSNTAVFGSNNLIANGTCANCTYGQVFSNMSANNKTFTATYATRVCRCNGTSNANCIVDPITFATSCITGCAVQPTYPNPLSNQPCNRNPDNRSTGTRISACGGSCGPACAPICGPAPTPVSGISCPCPNNFNSGLSPVTFSYTNCTCSYLSSTGPTINNNNPPNYNAPNYNAPSNNSPTFVNAPTNNAPNYNPPTFNPQVNNPPTSNPANCSCSDTVLNSANFVSFASTPASTACSNTQPCSTNNPTSYFFRNIVPCPVNVANCTVTTSGANAAYYKRGQIVRKSAGTLNVITNQDFGDVGNVYAYTSGNTIGFRQYSSTARGGTASNLVTYDAGNVTKGTKHGIIVTTVPYTQSYSISRFKVNT